MPAVQAESLPEALIVWTVTPGEFTVPPDQGAVESMQYRLHGLDWCDPGEMGMDGVSASSWYGLFCTKAGSKIRL